MCTSSQCWRKRRKYKFIWSLLFFVFVENVQYLHSNKSVLIQYYGGFHSTKEWNTEILNYSQLRFLFVKCMGALEQLKELSRFEIYEVCIPRETIYYNVICKRFMLTFTVEWNVKMFERNLIFLMHLKNRFDGII